MNIRYVISIFALMSISNAHAGLSGNVGLSSNYIWRGMTQSANSAAISGGLDYSHHSGVYVGTWLSNTATDSETDGYLGFSNTFSSLSYDVGYVRYHYPYNKDMGEIYLSLSYQMVGLAYYHDPENENGYIGIDASLNFLKSATLTFNLGSTFNKDSATDFMHYSASLNTTMGDWDTQFTLSSTNGKGLASAEDKPIAFVGFTRSFDIE